MKTILIVAATVGVTISAVVGYSYLVPNGAISSMVPSFLKSDFERLCLACEEKLKDRLKSPSSYVRLDCTGPDTKIPTLEELEQFSEGLDLQSRGDLSPSGESVGFHLAYEQTKMEADNLLLAWQVKKKARNYALRISEAILEYEAANSYGASIRNFKSCEAVHFHNDGYLDLLGKRAVKIGEPAKTWTQH